MNDSTSFQLSHKQRVFVEHYIRTMNATQAALEAGYSEKNARQQGCRLLTRPHIKKEVELAFTKSLPQGVVPSNDDLRFNRPKHKHGYVYLIAEPFGLIKIGKAIDAQKRLSSLAIACPYELELIAAFAVDDMAYAESLIHQVYADKRVRGEWFNLSELDVRAIITIWQT